MSDAASTIGDTQVRNRGTLGGSLAHADPSADMPAVMVALDAEIQLRSAKGERTVKATSFFQDLFTVDLQAGEIITAVRFAPVKAAAYAKLYQKASHYAIVGVAAVLDAKGGKIQSARIGLTGATTHAVRLSKLEQGLAGQSKETIEKVVGGRRGRAQVGQFRSPRERGVSSRDGGRVREASVLGGSRASITTEREVFRGQEDRHVRGAVAARGLARVLMLWLVSYLGLPLVHEAGGTVSAALGAVARSAKAAGQRQPPAQNVGQSEEALRSLDLTGELDSGKGRPLRMRRITVQPGGALALHNHVDRPAVTYMLSGEMTYHQDGSQIRRFARARDSPKAVRRHTGARTPARSRRCGSPWTSRNPSPSTRDALAGCPASHIDPGQCLQGRRPTARRHARRGRSRGGADGDSSVAASARFAAHVVDDGVTDALERTRDRTEDANLDQLTITRVKETLLSPAGPAWARDHRASLTSEVIAAAAR